ncbi:MAG TPA: preprotein translocase subunit YajC [Pseudomonadales bacterium]
MNLFETTAHAAEGAPPAGEPITTLIFLGGFILIFYFLLWRPQSKRRKEHQALMAGLSKGDEVVTAGGLVGIINKVEDDFVKVQVANNVELRIQKSAVGATLPKGTIKSLDEK